MSRSKRTVRVLVVIPAAALLMGACASGSTVALKVDDREVSVSELKSELASFLANKKFVTAVGGADAVGTVGNYKSAFVANVLTNELYNTVIAVEAAERKLQPAPATAELRTDVENSVGGKEVMDAFPATFQNGLMKRRLLAEALLQSYRKDQDPRKYFDTNKDKFAAACVSHVLVADEATAVKARARIVAGEDFAKVAKELSTDPGSKDAGGVLPCGPVSQYVAPFAAAASTLKINELSQPVKTDFGYHIVKVTKRDPPVYDANAKTVAEAATAEAANSRLNEDLATRLKAAKIAVNPNYGRLVAQSGTSGLPEIVAKDAKPNAKLVDSDPGRDTTPSSTTAS